MAEERIGALDAIIQGASAGAKLALARIVAEARLPLVEQVAELNEEIDRLTGLLEASEEVRERLHRALLDRTDSPDGGTPEGDHLQ